MHAHRGLFAYALILMFTAAAGKFPSQEWGGGDCFDLADRFA